MGLCFNNRTFRKTIFILALFFMLASHIGTVTAYALGDLELKIEDGKLSTSGLKEEDVNQVATGALEQYRTIVMVFLGFCLLSVVGIFIFYFTKLGATASNSRARQEVITGLIITGVATAGLGGVMIFFGFFYNLLS